MPVYNVEKYVEHALLSALNQTFDDIEFVIIDDKGVDASMDIVKHIMLTHPRGNSIRIVDHLINKGPGATRNTAIKEAKGRYLYFMDSDDEIALNCIEVLYNEMQNNSVDFVAASFAVCQSNHVNVIERYLLPKEKKIGQYALAHYYYYEGNPFFVATWNKLYDVEFLRSNNIECVPSHVNEDILFNFQLAIHTTSFILINDVTYYYYLHAGTTMHIQKKQGLSVKTAEQYREILLQKRTHIFDDKIFLKYGYLFAENYIDELYIISQRLITSPMLSKKQRQSYLGAYCDLSLLNKWKFRLKKKRLRVFFFLIRQSHNNLYQWFIVSMMTYLVLFCKRFRV
jgi:glycosyltransferase involved in cell wall biosynthesis